MNNKKNLGQVFTPKWIVNKMINLITKKNPNLILETSSGSGNFYYELIKKYKNVIGVEVDKKIAHKEAIIDSYFNTIFKPDVIIGNPPYVEYKKIENIPYSRFLKHKPNLCFFFLEKALNDLKDNGELIWIIPAGFFTTSSSSSLNKIIFENFSITYFELMQENIWDNASVPTAIIKIIKSKNHKDKINYFYSKGKIIFGNKPKIKEEIVVKVGGASGFNSHIKDGVTPFVVSHTERSMKLNNILYEPQKWIRPVPKKPDEFTYQIFVNCKTRKANPFYMLNFQQEKEFYYYDASVLCLFVKCNLKTTLKIIDQLNSLDWKKMGILRDGRYHFSQSILSALL